MASTVGQSLDTASDASLGQHAGRDLLDSSWRLVVMIGLPFWLAAATFRMLGMFVISQDVSGQVYFMLPIEARLTQHLVLVPFVLAAYRAAVQLGWPGDHRVAAASGHLVLALTVAALGRPVLLWVSAPYTPPELSMGVWDGLQGAGLRLWFSSGLDLMLAYLFGLVAMVFRRTSIALQQAELEQRRLQGAWTEARLQALRMQLSPHFLFNALNFVATMLDRDSVKARSVVLSLSELFRRTLATMDKTWGTLAEELAYAREYLRIQAARFDARLSFAIDSTDELDRIRLPAMLLQPLVENALVHGTNDDRATLHVWIKASRACAADGSMALCIEIGNHTSAQFDPGRGTHGVGLRVTRDRLEACYGDRGSQSLRIDQEDQHTFRVILMLPLDVNMAEDVARSADVAV